MRAGRDPLRHGPLVALLVRNDQYHLGCRNALANEISGPLLTTWLCVAEVMHFLGRSIGIQAQNEFWEWIAQRFVLIHQPRPDDWQRMRELMTRYAALPMAVADASLVVAAEQMRIDRIFTLDRHFRIYLINDQDPFTIVP